MMTIQALANELGVRYNSINKKINNVYREELKNHIIGTNPRMLDDFAIDFLKSKTQLKTHINSKRIEELEKELEYIKEKNEILSSHISFLQQQLDKKDEQLLFKDEQLVNQTQIINQAQALHLQSQNKLLKLEKTVDTKEKTEERTSFLSKLFR